MNAPPTGHPPFALRLVTVIGFATMLLGLGSAIYLKVIRDNDGDSISERGAIVEVRNIPTNALLDVTATWHDREQTKSESATRRPGTDEWEFFQAPVGRRVTLTVWRVTKDKREVFAQQTSILLRDRSVPIDLR